MVTVRAKTSHPAKFPKYVLDRVALHLRAEARALDRAARVLDPFAGVGRIHDLPRRIAETVGVELEPEWAACRERTIVGNATALPAEWTATFDAVATSPAYGNRLADAHEAKDNCAVCGGTGTEWTTAGCADVPMFCTGCGRADCVCGGHAKALRAHVRSCSHCRGHVCKTCNGAGVSRRYTYRQALGRMPSEGSSTTMQWGPGYRALHQSAWEEAHRVLRRNGLILINCKNHIRGGTEQTVVEWHAHVLDQIGFNVVRIEDLPSGGIRHGQNHDVRVDFERIVVARRR